MTFWKVWKTFFRLIKEQSLLQIRQEKLSLGFLLSVTSQKRSQSQLFIAKLALKESKPMPWGKLPINTSWTAITAVKSNHRGPSVHETAPLLWRILLFRCILGNLEGKNAYFNQNRVMPCRHQDFTKFDIELFRIPLIP